MSNHPGKILKHYIDRYKITAESLAENIGSPPEYINSIIAGNNWIDAELSYKLGIVFHTGMKFWLDLQSKHDISITKERLKDWNPKTVYVKGIWWPF